jgi:cyclohexadienyl dehydratase
VLACAAPPASEPLRIGTSGDYAPFSHAGAGFDMEVAQRLARRLGRRIVWVPFAWSELAAAVRENRFDVAMSGITWRPERALIGYMSRAVASGGPCVIGAPVPARVGVNRGGVLERWARASFGEATIVAVDDNLSLPGLLSGGAVDAIVTDSFELASFRRAGDRVRCAAPVDRKVYWVAPRHAQQLGPAIDTFLERDEAWLADLRERWLGVRDSREPVDHAIDLAARRLALMPGIAAWKRAHGRALQDHDREAQVLASAAHEASRLGLDPRAVHDLFALQVELAKAVQRRTPAGQAPLDLAAARALLLRLGQRTLLALAAGPLEVPDDARLVPLAPWLEPGERSRLGVALARASHPCASDCVAPASQ